MKRVQMFLAGAFIAVGSLYAQSSDAEWQAGVAKLKETIQTNPAQANEEAEQLIKGKNKKNVELLVAIGEVYLKAGKTSGSTGVCCSCQKGEWQIGSCLRTGGRHRL